MRSQLVQLSKNLETAIQMIQPSDRDLALTHRQHKKELYSKLLQGLKDEHQRILARKVYIEKKKELLEQQLRKKASINQRSNSNRCRRN
jgi:septum formation inhibitor MinC